MPTFNVKHRVIHPIEVTVVDAATREAAIHQVVVSADAGDEVEVLDAEEVVEAPAVP